MKIPATNARFIDEQGVEYELGNGVLTIGRADIIAWHEARVAELEKRLEELEAWKSNRESYEAEQAERQ
jgi:hypothetical protein